MDSNVYGPALPPGFKKNAAHCNSPERSSEEDEVVVSNSAGVIGPQLPPHLVKQKEAESNCEEDSQEDSRNVIGPALPPGFTLNQTGEMDEDDSDSDSVYGPMPVENNSGSVDDVVASIEKRAMDMKKKLQGIDKPVDNVAKREEWMTLPAIDYKNQFGAISRCLVGSEQKSSKKRPVTVSEEAHHSVQDEKMKEELDKYNKAKRPETLLEMHQNKKRKKDKESKKPKERKAFDRDAELGLRLMDQRQVNSVIHNAKRLNSRFSAGASQYL